MTPPLNPDMPQADDSGRWITAQELASYIGVSESWVRQCATAAGIRKYRLGGRFVRYDRRQIDALLLSGRIKRHD